MESGLVWGNCPETDPMPTIIKRDGGYQCRIRLAGHEPESEVFDTKARAQAWGFKREAELRDQKRGTVKATLQDAIDKYISDVCPTLKSGHNIKKRLLALLSVVTNASFGSL